MTAAVYGYKRFDHARFLAQDPGLTQDADWVRIFDKDDEDSIFRTYLDGDILAGEEFPGGTLHFHRTYHVDERAGEAWTINPHSGAALSSGTWHFED